MTTRTALTASGEARLGVLRRSLRAATASVALLALAACQTTDAPDAALAAGPVADGPAVTVSEAAAPSADSGISTGDAEVQQVAAVTDPAPANDPLEPFNRAIYGVNWYLDHVLVRPLAYAYRAGVPDPARDGVRNALRNLKSPIVLLNDSLQGEWDRAGNTAMRFLINSTIGVLGLIDVADGMGYPYHDEDFGQTLAVHGAGSGPYLVLPLLGPSNLRDGVGVAVDWALDPFRVYAATQNPSWDPEAGYVRLGMTALTTRTDMLDAIDEIERSSLDTYAALRTTYAQWRAVAIRNAEAGGSADSGVDGSAFDFKD